VISLGAISAENPLAISCSLQLEETNLCSGYATHLDNVCRSYMAHVSQVYREPGKWGFEKKKKKKKEASSSHLYMHELKD
jgi:hypothetical protein